MRAVLVGEGPHQTSYSRAQGVRKQQPFHRLLHGIGCDCQESAPLVFLHPRQRLLGKIHGAHQQLVGPQAPVFHGRGAEQFRRRPAGVGNTNIHAAKALFDVGHKPRDFSRVADVHRLPENFAACRRLNSRSCGLQVHRGACANGNFRTFAGQFLRHRASQPLPRRSHNRHASTQPQVHPGLQVQSFMFSRRAQTRQIGFTPLDRRRMSKVVK